MGCGTCWHLEAPQGGGSVTSASTSAAAAPGVCHAADSVITSLRRFLAHTAGGLQAGKQWGVDGPCVGPVALAGTCRSCSRWAVRCGMLVWCHTALAVIILAQNGQPTAGGLHGVTPLGYGQEGHGC